MYLGVVYCQTLGGNFSGVYCFGKGLHLRRKVMEFPVAFLDFNVGVFQKIRASMVRE